MKLSKIIWPNDNFHSKEIGFLLGIGSWVIAVVGLVYGKIVDKFSRKKILIFINILYGISLLSYSIIPIELGNTTFIFFIISTLIRAIAQAGLIPVTNSLVSDIVGENEKSKYFGLADSLFQIFQIIGIMVGALIFLDFTR